MEYWVSNYKSKIYPTHNFEFTWLLVGYTLGCDLIKSVWWVRKHETQSYRESCVFHFSHFELYIYIYMLVYIIKSGRKLISMILVLESRNSWYRSISFPKFLRFFLWRLKMLSHIREKTFQKLHESKKQCIFYAFILEKPFWEILISYLNYPKLHIFMMSIWKNLKLSRLTWTLLEWL